MKKLKKIRKPNLKLKQRLSRKQTSAVVPTGNVPRITTDTIAAHREEVLAGARKYIYPLQHAKHRIITITAGLLIAGVIGFFTYCTLALYRFHSTSTFMYRVTQVIPFPVARAGGDFISYESYLFEIRHYTHYYETQLKTDFSDAANKPQLTAFKKQALDRVIDDAYKKKLAAKYNVTVSDQQINDQITMLRAQNRLGSSDQVFEDVLQDYWGWSVDDFKRSLRDQLLGQNLVATLDTETNQRAATAHEELKAGADFKATVEKYSDDQATKTNGGDIGVIERTNRDMSAQMVEALYKLKPGQFSDIINIGYGLEIVKNVETTGDNRIHAAHIVFSFKDVSSYLNDLKDQQKANAYIKP